MHELTIAANVIDIADEYAKKANAKIIYEIEIEVGFMSGVVYEALEFALKSCTENTILENSKITIIRIPGIAKCKKCSHEFEIEDLYTPCPKCKHFGYDIIQGKELRVKSINID
jgi:hydrogenase nickel incorporation protein HypA/HybF